MKKFLLILIFLIALFGFEITCVSAADTNISFNTNNMDMSPGSSREIQMFMDNVPANGFYGYNITVSVQNKDIANITNVSFPDWKWNNGGIYNCKFPRTRFG